MCSGCLIDFLVENGEPLDPEDKDKILRVDDGKWKSKNLTTGHLPLSLLALSCQSQVNDDRLS